MTKMKILIISQPAFVNGLKLITKDFSEFSFEILSFNNKNWIGKSFLSKLIFLKDYDIIHFFRGRTKLFHFLLFRFLSKTKIVNHFIGTDLYRILKNNNFKKMKLKLCSKLSVTVSTGMILHKELNELKIKNEVLNFVNYDLKKNEYVFPKNKRAIVYLPSDKKVFFNQKTLFKLALDFPETEFAWFPYIKEKKEDLPTNVHCFDYISEQDLFSEMAKNKVFLRISEHDGLPNTLLEALSIGRWVIWTFPFKFVSNFNSYEQLKTEFDKLINKTESNIEGEKFVLENFNLDSVKKNFKEFYSSVLGI